LCLDQPQYQPFEIKCAINDEDIQDLVDDFNVPRIFEILNSEEGDLKLSDERKYTLFIAEDKLQECPKVKVNIGSEEITAILDTGCELCLMSQDLYNKLWDNGVRNQELPVQNMKLVSAFNYRARKVNIQAMLTLKFREVRVDQIFLIAPRLMTQVLIGVDFCVANKVTISFPDKCFSMAVDNQATKHMFLQGTDDSATSVNNSAFDDPRCSDVRLTSVVFLNSAETESLIDRHTINTPHKETESEVSTVRDSSGLAGSQVRSVGGSHCNMPPRQDACEDINNCFAKYEETRKILYEKDNAKSQEGNSHMSDDIESRKSEDMKTQKDARLCLVAGCDKTGTNGTTQATINSSDLSDNRNVTSEQLRAKVDENADLSDFQKERLYAILSKYGSHLTKRPGRCNHIEYTFEMTGDMPKSRNARPVTFTVRAQIKEQIQEMLKDNILEESFSDYVNTLTLVERPGKGIMICIDARRVNAPMILDRVKVDPMKELLQRFQGSNLSRPLISAVLSSRFHFTDLLGNGLVFS